MTTRRGGYCVHRIRRPSTTRSVTSLPGGSSAARKASGARERPPPQSPFLTVSMSAPETTATRSGLLGDRCGSKRRPNIRSRRRYLRAPIPARRRAARVMKPGESRLFVAPQRALSPTSQRSKEYGDIDGFEVKRGVVPPISPPFAWSFERQSLQRNQKRSRRVSICPSQRMPPISRAAVVIPCSPPGACSSRSAWRWARSGFSTSSTRHVIPRGHPLVVTHGLTATSRSIRRITPSTQLAQTPPFRSLSTSSGAGRCAAPTRTAASSRGVAGIVTATGGLQAANPTVMVSLGSWSGGLHHDQILSTWRCPDTPRAAHSTGLTSDCIALAVALLRELGSSSTRVYTDLTPVALDATRTCRDHPFTPPQ